MFCVYCACVCVRVLAWPCHGPCIESQTKNAWELVFAFHSMDSENHTQVTMLGGKCLHTEQTHIT